MKTLSENNVG